MSDRDAESELAAWRADWVAETPPVPNAEAFVSAAVRRHRTENVVTALVTMAALALYAGLLIVGVSAPLTLLAGAGILFVVVAMLVHLRVRRGTWRAVNGTTRAFLELTQRRARAQLRGFRIARVLVLGWIVVALPLAIWSWQQHRFSLAFLGGALTGATPLLVFAWWWSRRARAWAERELAESDRLLSESL